MPEPLAAAYHASGVPLTPSQQVDRERRQFLSRALEILAGVPLVTDQARSGSRRRGKRQSCYTIDARGCSSKVFRVVQESDEPLYSDLLSSRSFLSEHSRQNMGHLGAVLAQKPIWTRGPGCCSGANLTTPAPDSSEVEVVPESVVYGSEADFEADDDAAIGSPRDVSEQIYSLDEL